MSDINNNSDSGATLSFKLSRIYASYRYCHEIEKQLDVNNADVFSVFFDKKEKRFKYDFLSKFWVGNKIIETLGKDKGDKLKELWKDPIGTLGKEGSDKLRAELETLKSINVKSIEDVLEVIGYESLFKEKFKDIDFKKVPDKNCPPEEQIKWVESLIRCWSEMPIKYAAPHIQNIALKALEEEKSPIKAIYIKYKKDREDKSEAIDAKYWPPRKWKGIKLPYLEGEPEEFKSGEKLKFDEIMRSFSFHLFNILSDIKDRKGVKGYEVYSFPIYDVYLNDEQFGCGGIWGLVCVVLPTGKYVSKRHIEKIVTPYLPHMSNDIAQSQLLEVTNSHENASSFLENFREVISKMQQWEKIETYSKKAEDAHVDLQQKYPDDEYFRWNFHEAVKIFFNESEKDEHKESLHSEFIFKYPKIAVIPDERSGKEQFKHKLLKQQFQMVEIALNSSRRFTSAEQLAASAIMSRNMSHNIGSHVLAEVVSSDDKTESEKNKDFVENLQSSMDHLAEVVSSDDKTESEKNEHFVEDLQNRVGYLADFSLKESEMTTKHRDLFRYLQSRMDHLAEMATTQTTGFYRFMSFDFKYIQEEFNEQKLLCEYITGMKVPVEVEISEIKNDTLDKKSIGEIYAAIPNGHTGIHAFYIILENYIRNALKHNAEVINPKKKKFCVAVVEDKVKQKQYLKISLWEPMESIPSCFGCLFFPKLSTKFDSLKEKAIDIADKIKESVINKDDLSIRDGFWGIAEMTISADYLLCDNPEKLPLKVYVVDTSKHGKSPEKVFDPSAIDEEGKDNEEGKEGKNRNKNLCLMYEFYMEKPREILIVKDSTEEEKKSNERLEAYGIKIIDEIGDIEGNPGYQNLVFLNESWNNKDNKDKERWPLKTFMSDDSKNGRFTSGDEKKFNDLLGKLSEGKSSSPYPLFSHLEECWINFLCRRHEIKKREKTYLCNSGRCTGALGESYGVHKCEKAQDDEVELITYWHHEIPCDSGAQNSWFVDVYTGHDQGVFESTIKWDGNSAKKGKKEFFEQRYLSAGLTTVVVLDERIQEVVERFREEKQPCDEGEFFEKKHIIAGGHNRVYVPSVEKVDLYHPEWEDIKKYLDDINKSCSGIDSVIIHLGVLQNLEKREGKKCYINCEIDPPPLSISVCTGRGRASDSYKIVPYSEVARWVTSLQYSSKYQLCQML